MEPPRQKLARFRIHLSWMENTRTVRVSRFPPARLHAFATQTSQSPATPPLFFLPTANTWPQSPSTENQATIRSSFGRLKQEKEWASCPSGSGHRPSLFCPQTARKSLRV